MDKESGTLGNGSKTFLVKDRVNVGTKEYSVLSVIDWFRTRALLIRVPKHAILAEPALFASWDQVCVFRTLNMVCYATGDVASERRFG
jgi:hypothetical protein